MSFSVCSQHWKMTAPQTEKARAMIVRKLRLKRGWSQGQLAEMAGVTTRTIQRIEQGHRSSMETSKALASVFEVELSLRSEEHTSELQSRGHLVCRLLLEKKNKRIEQSG